MTYYEKLQNPLWQKKRLEILERDNWKCVKCQSTENTLHVHHKTYDFDKEPWDYQDKNFITLCNKCHKEEELHKVYFNHTIKYLLKNGISYNDLLSIISDKFLETYEANEQKGNNNG